MAAVAQLHLDGERVAGLGQVVAEHAVERGEHRLALRPGRALAEQRRERAQLASATSMPAPTSCVTPRMLP